MAFPRKLLTEDEDVLLDLRPHWKALVVPAFWSIVLWVGAGLLIARIESGIARWAIFGGALLVWWLLAGLDILRWRFTEFVLTNERLISRSGVIAKRTKEIPLERINDVTTSQTVLDRILGSGDITLESAGEFGQNTFDDIADPTAVQKEIYRAAEARKGLRRSAPPRAIADEIAKLADLRAGGVLSTEEFEAQKRELLGD